MKRNAFFQKATSENNNIGGTFAKSGLFRAMITTIALCILIGFSAKNTMAQNPDCDDVCRNGGQWGPEKTKTVTIWNDGFCKANLTYREKICGPCITEIEVIFPIEVYDCNYGLADIINGNEGLLRQYAIDAYRSLTRFYSS